jgi:DNA-binding response OmpR family regulator
MKKRILVADDDESVRTMLARVLESEGYTVIAAGTGREAIARFVTARADLVLLDLNMPEKDGWKVFDAITRISPLAPVIVITARPNQYERAAGLGIDALMEKPLDLPLLLKTIRLLLAEAECDRVGRLTDRNFKTVLLAPVVEIQESAGAPGTVEAARK